MNRKKISNLKIVIILCLIFIFVELIVILFHYFGNREQSIYFESINAIIHDNKTYISVGSNNDNVNHYEKAKISKYNAKKEKVFEKLYNIGYNSVFFGAVMDSDNIVAVGSYEKNLDEHNSSIRRALIVKYDKDGNEVFSKDFQMLDNSKFTSIVKLGDDYLVTGNSIYRNTKVGNKVGGAVLAKYNKDGLLEWKTTYGSNKSAIFNDLIVIDNYIYVVGTDENYLGIIVKYDLDGNLITYNDYNTTDSLGFSGIASIDDNIYISGALRRENDNTDAMIVKYDLDCNYIDQVVYAEEGLERFNKIIIDEDSIIAIGIMAIAKKETGISEFNYDGLVAKYDLDLKYIDSVKYGDDRDDFFTDIIIDKDQYIVSGYSSYEDYSYMSKFIRYSKALKVLGVD